MYDLLQLPQEGSRQVNLHLRWRGNRLDIG